MKIAVAGGGGGGKTTVAAALARGLGRAKVPTLAIECDYVTPALAMALGMGAGATESVGSLRWAAHRANVDLGHPVWDGLSRHEVAGPDGIRYAVVERFHDPILDCP